MSFFAGVENAQVSESGSYLTDGDYDVIVDRVTLGSTRKKIPFFALDVTVEGSSDPVKHPIGSKRNWFVGFDKDSALGNVRQWGHAIANALSAAEGGGDVDVTAINQQFLDAICADNGKSVRGVKLKVNVVAKPTSTGGTFSKHTWFPKAQ